MGASPRLGLPGLYGGAWNTVPLRDGSPAIDRIPLSVCSGGLDRRLKPRPARGGCDLGGLTIPTAQFVNRPSSLVNFALSRVIVRGIAP
jgi:hypothetical protein